MNYIEKMAAIRESLRYLAAVNSRRPDLAPHPHLGMKAWFNAIRAPDAVLEELDNEIEIIMEILREEGNDTNPTSHVS